MRVQNRAACLLRTSAGPWPRPWRGTEGLVRARPCPPPRAPSPAPPPPFGLQARPRAGMPVPPSLALRRRRRTDCGVSLRRPAPRRTSQYACVAAASASLLGVRPSGGSRRVARRARAGSRRRDERVPEARQGAPTKKMPGPASTRRDGAAWAPGRVAARRRCPPHVPPRRSLPCIPGRSRRARDPRGAGPLQPTGAGTRLPPLLSGRQAA